MKQRRYVTISQRRTGWRISAKQTGRDWNSLDIQLAETTARTEEAARKAAERYAAAYGAEILN